MPNRRNKIRIQVEEQNLVLLGTSGENSSIREEEFLANTSTPTPIIPLPLCYSICTL